MFPFMINGIEDIQALQQSLINPGNQASLQSSLKKQQKLAALLKPQQFTTNNFSVLTWKGTADGTKLTRAYTSNFIQTRFIKIKDIKFTFYAPSTNTVIQEVAVDTTSYAASGNISTNANTRYSLTPQYGLIKPDAIHLSSQLASITIDIDSNNLSVFDSAAGYSMQDLNQKDLNIIHPTRIEDGIDFYVTLQLCYDLTDTTKLFNPYVVVSMSVYLLDEKSLDFTEIELPNLRELL